MSPNDAVRRFSLSLVMLAVFWGIAVVLWLGTGQVFYLLNFGYIGAALALGVGFYTALPSRRKPFGRRLAQFLVGTYLLVFLGFVARENLQLEGFFFYLFAGFFAGSVIHYLVAKIVGPLLFNRGWCGWACWTAMVLDLLPFRRRRAPRLPRGWESLRYAHFALSLGLVAALGWVGRYRLDPQSPTELSWLLAGNLLYYAVGIGLALALKDNRAFCKYVCPITAFLKPASRFALQKVAGDREKCTAGGACQRACPMDIDIVGYVQKGQWVLSTECIMCQECLHACPRGALSVTFALDRRRG